MAGVVQSIPSDVHPGVCCLCNFHRTLCADVVFRGQACVLCSACRVAKEGWWTPAAPARPEASLPEDEPRARVLGRGLRARSPSKHSMPFTF